MWSGSRRPPVRAAAVGVVVALVASTLGLLATGTPAAAEGGPQLSVGDATVIEGNAGTAPGKLAVRLSEPLPHDLFITYSTVPDTASAWHRTANPTGDYKPKVDKTLTIRAGKTVSAIGPAVVGDTEIEGTEQLEVVLSATSDPTVDIVRPTGVVTILDDDPAPEGAVLSIGDASVVEGNSMTVPGKLGLRLSEPLPSDLFVNYTIVAATAEPWHKTTNPAGDFKPKTGSVKMAAGKLVGVIGTTAMGDVALEGDEQFGVMITGVSLPGVTLGKDTGVVTILDDDGDPAPEFTVPDAPVDLTAVTTPGSPQSVDLAWSAPIDDGGSAITGYQVELTTDGGTTWLPWSAAGTTSLTLPGLVTGETYEFRVRAVNEIGPGEASSSSGSIVIPEFTVPTAPTDVVASLTEASPGWLDISWTLVSSDGGDPVTLHFVEFTTDAGASWQAWGYAGDVPPTTIFCGVPAVTCQVRVTARNEAGHGPTSTPSDPIVTPDVPGSPLALTAVNTDGQPGSVDLAWSAPASDGGDALAGYEYQVSDDAGVTWSSSTPVGAATSTTISGLTGGAIYRFRVMAVNGAGVGAAATSDSVVIPAFGVPDAPTGVVIANGATPGEADVSWIEPADNGSVITSYLVEISTEAGSTWTNAGSSPDTSFTVDCGLGATCRARVYAINVAGSSVASAASADVVTPDVPAAPTAVTAANTPDLLGSVDLTWTAPASDGGLPITSYTVEYSEDAGGSWIEWGPTGSASTSATVFGFNPSTSYWFRVIATNAAGDGAPSASSGSVVIPALEVPGAATALVASMSMVIGGSIDVSWTAPTVDGGTPVVDYRIEITSNAGSTWTDAGNSGGPTSATVACGLGKTCRVRVYAINTVGEGPVSTLSNSVSIPPLPSPPSSVVAVQNAIDATYVDASWNAGAGNGAPIQAYGVEISRDGGASWDFVDMTEPDERFTSVPCGVATTCVFRVYTVTWLGSGAYSTPSNPVTTPG